MRELLLDAGRDHQIDMAVACPKKGIGISRVVHPRREAEAGADAAIVEPTAAPIPPQSYRICEKIYLPPNEEKSPADGHIYQFFQSFMAPVLGIEFWASTWRLRIVRSPFTPLKKIRWPHLLLSEDPAPQARRFAYFGRVRPSQHVAMSLRPPVRLVRFSSRRPIQRQSPSPFSAAMITPAISPLRRAVNLSSRNAL